MKPEEPRQPKLKPVLLLLRKLGKFLSVGGGALGWKRFFVSNATDSLQFEVPIDPAETNALPKGSRIFSIFRILATMVAAGGGALAWKQCFLPPPVEQKQEEGDPRVSRLLDKMLNEYETPTKEGEQKQKTDESDEP